MDPAAQVCLAFPVSDSNHQLIDRLQKFDMTGADVNQIAQNNQKLGAFPMVKLANGQSVPTGTVATLLYNIREYDKLIAEGESLSDDKKVELEKLAGEIKAPVPILIKLGMFELFNLEEWCAGNRPGRTLVGRTAKELLGQQ